MKEASAAKVQILLTNLGFGESPRWHQNRSWFANWGTGQIVAVDLAGKSEVMVRVPQPCRTVSTGYTMGAFSSSPAPRVSFCVCSPTDLW